MWLMLVAALAWPAAVAGQPVAADVVLTMVGGRVVYEK
jgi:hypothetical protein